MHSKLNLTLGSLAIILATGACNKPLTTPDGREWTTQQVRADLDRFWNAMTDSAITRDMSMADIHFVAHTSHVNTTGASRLDRLAPILETYGGLVRYDTALIDDEMIASRIESLHEYLTTAGVDMKNVEIKRMLSGGRTITGAEGVPVQQRGISVNAQGASASSDSSLPGGAPGGFNPPIP